MSKSIYMLHLVCLNRYATSGKCYARVKVKFKAFSKFQTKKKFEERKGQMKAYPKF